MQIMRRDYLGIQYIIATAERPELMGFSDHVVQVLEKTKG